MQRLLNWLDKYLLEIGVISLLIFIPLYPKFPLIDVPNTWVYIRFEDVIVAAVVGIWLVQLLRRKITLKIPLTFSILFYWLVGGVSLLFSLIFLRAHLANFFPHVAVLHYLRRIEYMVVFFIAASTIRDLKVVKRYLFFIILTFVGVCLYGFGQKFLGFPAYLTMNEEFAKGIPLYLPSTARMTSTFAGHYDLAAYLVLMITLLGSLIFGFKNWLLRIFLLILAFTGFTLLLFTNSRISFVVYLVAVSFMLYLQKKKWLIIPVVLVSLFLMNYIPGASGRFAKTFRIKQVVYDLKTGKPIATLEEEAEIGKIITEKEEIAKEELPLGPGYIAFPPVFETEAPEATQVAVIKKLILTSLKTATKASEIATISGEFLIKRAIVYDVSFTTRFQGTWPRALNAFRRNPILGTGYSSISLATDNSYLRALGETGFLGLFAFLSLLFALGLLARQGLARITSPFGRSILIGMTAGVLGLMLNAFFIDVFEASKVAFTLWAFLGITAGMINFYLPKRKSLIKEVIEVVKLPITAVAILTILTPLIFWSSLKNYFIGDDFTWLRWAATSKISDIPQFFLSAQGFFYRPLAKVYFLLVQPIFGLKPQGYHAVDFLLHLGCVIGAYLLILLITRRKFVSFLASLIFLIHPINAESVLWVSSTSALFASLFYIWGFLAYLQWRQGQKGWKHLFFGLALLAFILGLASHELMITFPLIILFYDLLFSQFKFIKIISHLPFWILADVYLYFRNIVAQAHWLSGDYSYNLANLPFNFVGNLLGYFGELVASFHFIPFYDLARSYLRSHKSIALTLLIIGFLMIKKFSKRFKFNRIIVFFIGWFIILLLPFLGLGNIAERHVYPAHLGFFGLFALFIDWILRKVQKRSFIIGFSLTVIILGAIFGSYYYQMEKTKQGWCQAGETANKILLALSSNYAEFPLDSTLYFVNLPIRQDRAWVFPVGIEDGIWFIYRDKSLTINRTTDLEETLDLAEGKPNTYVFLYEEGELKEVKR